MGVVGAGVSAGHRERTDGCFGVETLTDLVEHRADPGTRARIEQHASRCERCREILSALARSGTPRLVSSPSDVDAEPVLAPGTPVGRYVIMGELGAGGMGVVYAAHDPELDRIIAIKLLRSGSDPRLQERLRREAKAMAQLAHPHVVAVYDVGAFDERMFIAMEYVAGDTLARWIATRRSRHEILETYCAAGRGLAVAHAAGIVHRDFKSENVLIGDDGRVRVGDFGLARAIDVTVPPHGGAIGAGTEESPASAHGSPTRAALTATGTLLGTPYYMAPELYSGADADPRSDQFSFCVALFTALHGERPFGGDTLDELGANVRAGRMREPERVARVPRRIRAALRRGLSVDPAARFASLDELLAELAPPPRRLARGAIALVAALAVAAWLAPRSAEVPDQRCTGAAAAFATAWNASSRGAIETAFSATHLPYAATTLTRVTGAFDRYAAQWTQAHTEACRATRILGEQTEAMLQLRMVCLERRRQEAAALVAALAAPDAGVVARAATAAQGLTEVAACADLAALQQIVPPPDDATTRAKLAELTPRLAEARAAYEVGAYPRALELARPVTAQARTLGYRPFEAEAEFVQSWIEYAMGDWKHAETTLEQVVWSAEAGKDDQIAARAWVWLVFVIGYGKAEYARGLALVPRATAALTRIGGSAEVESLLERALGAIDGAEGRLDASLAHHEKAIALAERAFGADSPRITLSLLNLASQLLEQGHADRALPILTRALEILERSLGGDHPRTAQALHTLASAHIDLGHPALAEQALRRTLAIREASFGPQHPELAGNLIFLAQALDDQGKSEEAVALGRRAVMIGETAYGREHPNLGAMLVDLGAVLGHAGRYAEAADHMRRGEAILRKAHGPRSFQVMLALIERGNLLIRQSRWRDAVALYQQALPELERTQLARKELTTATINRELAFIELRQPARGLPPLEHLAARLDDLRPDLRAAAEFTLARALWDTGGDRRRACALATHALGGINQLDGIHRDDAAPIERWLASHHAP